MERFDVTLRIVDAKSAKLKKDACVKALAGSREVFRTSNAPTAISLSDAVAAPRAVWTPDAEPPRTIYDYSPARDGPLRLSVCTAGGDSAVGAADLPQSLFVAAKQPQPQATTIVLPLAPAAAGGRVGAEAVAVPSQLTRVVPLVVKGWRRCLGACCGPLLLFFRSEKRAPPAACAELSIDLSAARVVVGAVSSDRKKPPPLTVEAADGASYVLHAESLADGAWWHSEVLARAGSVVGAPIPAAASTPKKSATAGKQQQQQSQCRLFGLTLDELAATTEKAPKEDTPPALFETLFAFVESHLEEGVYRQGSSPSEVEKTFAKINALSPQAPLLDLGSTSVYTVCGVVKLLLRKLGSPLLPAGATSLPEEDRAAAFRKLADALDPRSRALLVRITKHLNLVTTASETTKMKPSAVGIVFGPILTSSEQTSSPMAGNALAEMLATHGEALFAPPMPLLPAAPQPTDGLHDAPQTQEQPPASSHHHHHHRRHSKRPSIVPQPQEQQQQQEQQQRSSSHHRHRHSSGHHRPTGSGSEAVAHALSKTSFDPKRVFRIFDSAHCGKIEKAAVSEMLGELLRAANPPERMAGLSSEGFDDVAQQLSDAHGKVSWHAFKSWWFGSQPLSAEDHVDVASTIDSELAEDAAPKIELEEDK